MTEDYGKSLTSHLPSPILSPMKKHLLNVLDNTGKVFHGLRGMNRNLVGPGADRFLPILLALTPAIFAAFAVTEAGAAFFGELARRRRLREKLPDSPSLRGAPTPAELEDDWMADPRTLTTRLRLGSRLADLDPTIDHTVVRKKNRHGKLVIRSRKGGLKGWLSDRRVRIPYSTAMRYKKLAQRLRAVLELDDRLPLEWVLSGVPADRPLPAELDGPCAAATRRLAKILRENRSLAGLARYVEAKLGIVRVLAVRKAPARRRTGGAKSRKRGGFSVISCGRSVSLAPERVEGTKAALAELLAEENLSGRALELQSKAKRWLESVADGA